MQNRSKRGHKVQTSSLDRFIPLDIGILVQTQILEGGFWAVSDGDDGGIAVAFWQISFCRDLFSGPEQQKKDKLETVAGVANRSRSVSVLELEDPGH